MKTTPFAAVCFALLAGLAAPSRAEDSKAAQDPTAENPCGDDVQKYCPGKWPGTPEFGQCMRSHMSDFTPACAAFARKRAAASRPAETYTCIADAKQHCPGLTSADGPKFVTCMTSHYDKLSAACQATFKDLHESGATDCMEALKPLCPGAEPGSREMIDCMMAHPKDIPESCRKMGNKKGK